MYHFFWSTLFLVSIVLINYTATESYSFHTATTEEFPYIGVLENPHDNTRKCMVAIIGPKLAMGLGRCASREKTGRESITGGFTPFKKSAKIISGINDLNYKKRYESYAIKYYHFKPRTYEQAWYPVVIRVNSTLAQEKDVIKLPKEETLEEKERVLVSSFGFYNSSLKLDDQEKDKKKLQYFTAEIFKILEDDVTMLITNASTFRNIHESNYMGALITANNTLYGFSKFETLFDFFGPFSKNTIIMQIDSEEHLKFIKAAIDDDCKNYYVECHNVKLP